MTYGTCNRCGLPETELFMADDSDEPDLCIMCAVHYTCPGCTECRQWEKDVAAGYRL